MQNNSRDRELVEKLLKGDLKAFDSLFTVYAQRLYGFANKFLHSGCDAEELVQDVFVKVWENRTKLKIDASFKSYLFTIAYRGILNRMRSEKYHQAYLREAVFLSQETNDALESVEYASILEQVDLLLEQLPEKRRQIFIKSRMEGCSSKQIAEELHISVGTVDNNISAVLKLLRTNLQKELLAVLMFLTIHSI